ncbi:hypothetical protein EGP64_01510 [bacterium]|nr:hypothetical protein [bacterium]
MEYDLFCFVKKYILIKEEPKQITVELQLKELMEKNEEITIVLKCGDTEIKKIIFTRRNHD